MTARPKPTAVRDLPEAVALRALTRDAKLVFATRAARMAAYGALAVVLAVYLAGLGFTPAAIGLLMSLTLVGDTFVSLLLSTRADRWGRRRTLAVGALLVILAGAVLAVSHNYLVVLVACIVGVISPSGNEVGPFLAVEQAALSEEIPGAQRTGVFAWFNLLGSFATALGALVAGGLVGLLQALGFTPLNAERGIVWLYAATGLILAILFTRLSERVEAPAGEREENGAPRRALSPESRPTILKLSALFTLDAFGGGFVVQSLIAYWFHLRFGLNAGLLGTLLFFTNLLAGISALFAARLARRIGLINTMVFTHLPSNVLLMLVPLMPNVYLAVALLLARFAISQMDVPARQAFTMAVVKPEERSTAAGLTGAARTAGAAVSPALAGALIGAGWLAWPFILSGLLKSVYDLGVYRAFTGLHVPED
ncbi:MAG TPA: MFS transporter [Deinococcales bacterium]|nr:MFS transporter [Deinococcales bacterium]